MRGTVKVAEISAKMQERRLNWYGHVMRDEDHIGRKVMEQVVPGRRRRGRPKFRWGDRLKEDLRSKGVGVEQIGEQKGLEGTGQKHDPI